MGIARKLISNFQRLLRKRRVMKPPLKAALKLPRIDQAPVNEPHTPINANPPKENVLMFGWELPPFNSGGLGVACYEMAKSLNKSGQGVTFVLPERQLIKAPWMKMLYAPDFKAIGINTSLYPYANQAQYHPISGEPVVAGSHRLIQDVKKYALAAREIAQQEKYSVIHAHDWLSYPAGVAAKEVSGKPLIVHVHATEFDRVGGNNIDPEIYNIEGEGLRQADHIIAVSHYTKNKIIEHYHIDAKKISVVHNGINTDDYQDCTPSTLESFKRAGYKIVLFVGRLTVQKGPDYFIQAAQKVLLYNPKTIFVMAGSGDMERRLIDDAVRLGIGDKVIFTGFVRGKDLSRLYRSADLYVMPSVSEPFGIVALESLAHGVPVLISKQSGVSEVINHALKTNFWDVEDMAQKMIGALRYPILRKVMQINGSAEVKRTTWDSAAQKMIDIYNRVLSGS